MVGDATSWVQARLIPFVGTFIWSGCSHAVLHPMSPDGVCVFVAASCWWWWQWCWWLVRVPLIFYFEKTLLVSAPSSA